MKAKRNFASDNNAGVHPKLLAAIQEANTGHVLAYGEDAYTKAAELQFKRVFGSDIEVFFVFNGTAANVLSLGTLVKSHEAIICSEHAHIHSDECGAPERLLGSKLLTIPTEDGKFTARQIEPHLLFLGDQHRVQPKAISISQTTEMGTLWKPDEIKDLSRFAKKHDLYLHMDGARISNAAAALGLSLKEATRDLGIDVLSFGGTKIGMMFGEAVVLFRPELARGFEYQRKQSLQLASKMRFISTQFEVLLKEELWLANAQQANQMAKLLETEVRKIQGVEVARPTEANAVFARLPRTAINRLREVFDFHVWLEDVNEVRWMTAFDTTEQDVREFAAAVKNVL